MARFVVPALLLAVLVASSTGLPNPQRILPDWPKVGDRITQPLLLQMRRRMRMNGGMKSLLERALVQQVTGDPNTPRIDPQPSPENPPELELGGNEPGLLKFLIERALAQQVTGDPNTPRIDPQPSPENPPEFELGGNEPGRNRVLKFLLERAMAEGNDGGDTTNDEGPVMPGAPQLGPQPSPQISPNDEMDTLELGGNQPPAPPHMGPVPSPNDTPPDFQLGGNMKEDEGEGPGLLEFLLERAMAQDVAGDPKAPGHNPTAGNGFLKFLKDRAEAIARNQGGYFHRHRILGRPVGKK